MSAPSSALATEFDQASGSVVSSLVSVSKWRPVQDLIAEALAVDPGDVYVATVSKAGNLGVRFGQSKRARDASVAIAMYDDNDPVELQRIVSSAETKFAEEDRDLVLVFASGRQWSLIALVKHTSDPVPPALAAAWPAATVLSM
jgi:hypothetical protein